MKEKIITAAIGLLAKQGIRLTTIKVLAREIGTSKESIYAYFENKDVLLLECIKTLALENMAVVEKIVRSSRDPLIKVCDIYAHCLKVLLQFPVSFFFELKKYHSEANDIFYAFKTDLVFKKVVTLLSEAREKGLLQEGINIDLVCKIHLFRIEELVDTISLRQNQTYEELLLHLIVNNIRGLTKREHGNILDNYLQAHTSS